jgi:hypothetical protein
MLREAGPVNPPCWRRGVRGCTTRDLDEPRPGNLDDAKPPPRQTTGLAAAFSCLYVPLDPEAATGIFSLVRPSGRPMRRREESGANGPSAPRPWCLPPTLPRPDFMTTVRYRAGAGSDCFPAYRLGGHGGQCPHRSRARRRSSSLSGGRCDATQSLLEPRAPASSCRAGAGATPPSRHASASCRPRARYRGGRGSSFRGFAARHYPTTVERGQRGETHQTPPAHRGRARRGRRAPRTSLQCRENVVHLARAREQLRELGTA